MSIFVSLLAAERRHSMKSCGDIAFEFMKDGHEIFHKYTRGSFHQKKFEPKTYCFDDLGLESTMNFYGNQCSVMAEILLSRYDLFHSFGMITHITTNLNSTEIEKNMVHGFAAGCVNCLTWLPGRQMHRINVNDQAISL